jgi:prepilin-type N-terminal cleavage/methylation domain-containing protein
MYNGWNMTKDEKVLYRRSAFPRTTDQLGFTLLELLIVIVLMIVLLNVPYGGWIIVLGLACYGLYRYVRFCKRNPSIWQMRRRSRRLQGKEEQQDVSR